MTLGFHSLHPIFSLGWVLHRHRPFLLQFGHYFFLLLVCGPTDISTTPLYCFCHALLSLMGLLCIFFFFLSLTQFVLPSTSARSVFIPSWASLAHIISMGIPSPLSSFGHPQPIPLLHSHGFFAEYFGLPQSNYHLLYSWGLLAFALTPSTNSFLQTPLAHLCLLSTSYDSHGLTTSFFGAPLSPLAYVPLSLPFGPNDFSYFANSSFFTLCYIVGFFLLLALFFFAKMRLNIQPPKHMNRFCGSYVNENTFLHFLFAGFFEQWATPYFLCCHEQCCLFGFPSLIVILKHSFCFINTMLLLTANSLHLFTSSLLWCEFLFLESTKVH